MTDQKDTQAKKAFQGPLSQAEVNYIPLTKTLDKACANCRWDGCFIVASDSPGNPEPILATGYCDRHELNPAPEPSITEQVIEAVGEAAVDALMGVQDSIMMLAPYKENKKTLFQRFTDLFKSAPKLADSFTLFKDANGVTRWHSVHTNNYEDLEGEILTEKAHDNYIARLDMGLVPMPVLQAWHTPGSEHGVADVVWRNDHFIHAIGHFYDNEFGQKALKFYEKNAKNLKMSHGFTVPDWAFDGKHYSDYNTIEITTLPAFAAANPYTSFEELKTMVNSPEKEKYLKEMLGEDGYTKLQQTDAAKAKALETLQVQYKDHANVQPPAPVSTPAPAQGNLSEREKALAEAYTELMEGQNQLVELMGLNAKALEGQKAINKQMQDQITALDQKHEKETAAFNEVLQAIYEQLNMPIERPSQSKQTHFDKDTNPLGLGDKLPTGGANGVIAYFGGKEKQPALS